MFGTHEDSSVGNTYLTSHTLEVRINFTFTTNHSTLLPYIKFDYLLVVGTDEPFIERTAYHKVIYHRTLF